MAPIGSVAATLLTWKRMIHLVWVALVDILLQLAFFPRRDNEQSQAPAPRRACVLVTGANAGVGRDLVKRLLAHDSLHAPKSIIMACRSTARGAAALKLILSELALQPDNVNVHVAQLDLDDLASVRRLAKDLAQEHIAVDTLILNAGVMAVDRNDEDIETHFAVNHLGHFLLTMLLLPGLQTTPDARIIVVSSSAAVAGDIQLNDLNFARRGYNKMLAYCDSKLANLLFSIELSERMRRLHPDSSLTVNAVHPGEVATDISRNLPGWMGAVHRALGGILLSPAESARALAYLATSEQVTGVTGRFFWHVTRGPVFQIPAAGDILLRTSLWDRSAQLVGMTDSEKRAVGGEFFNTDMPKS